MPAYGYPPERDKQLEANEYMCDIETKFQLALIDFLENNNFPNTHLLEEKRKILIMQMFANMRVHNYVTCHASH